MKARHEHEGRHGADPRKAFREAVEAMSEWRDEINAVTERHRDETFEKLAKAAKSAGWPEQLVDTSKKELLEATKMQSEVMDHMLDTFEEQVGGGGRMRSATPSSFGLPSQAGQTLMMEPTRAWMQMMMQWQRTWTDSMLALWKATEQASGTRRH